MAYMSAVRVVEYLDSAITAVRGDPADEGGHGTGHVTVRTRGPVTVPFLSIVLSCLSVSYLHFIFSFLLSDWFVFI